MSTDNLLFKALGLANVLADEDVEFIFKAVVNDVGHHGDFLKSFAGAYLRADVDNRFLMKPAALVFVVKYNLIRHLPDGGEAVRKHLSAGEAPAAR